VTPRDFLLVLVCSLGRVERDWYEAYRALMKSQFSHSGRLAGRKRPTDARPARVLRRYTGVYLNRLYGPARVILRGRRLVLRIGPKPLRFRLDHWSGNTFFYTPSGENASGRAAIDFRFNRRSRGAVSIRIENLDPEGQGLFRRKLHFAQKSPRRR
jgi:hypothetical protein